MATKKDLVEAYSFSRRRLITAFVSGAPGGREVEPSRPGRMIVGGIALGVLLCVGAAVTGILKPPSTIDWNDDSLVSEKETGADYVVLADEDGGRVLRPVANITSAMLLLGADIEPQVVKHDTIAQQARGEAIGILGAPATPPETSSLVPSGWTACTRDGDGLQVTVSSAPQVTPVSSVGMLVRAADNNDLYLVAEATLPGHPTRAYTYQVPNNQSTELLLQNLFAAGSSPIMEVPRSFIGLFPTGGELGLSSFGIARGQVGDRSPLAGTGGVPGNARTGQVLVAGGSRYLLTRQGSVRLTAFADAVWSSLSVRDKRKPADLEVNQGPSVPAPPDLAELGISTWPTELVQQNTADDICAQLQAGPNLEPAARLAIAAPGSDAAPDDVEPDEISRDVESGHGAFVTVGDWDVEGQGALVLIDDRGFAYPVAGEAEQTNLGYSGVDEVIVPDAWTSLFVEGVPLSIDAARCAPSTQGRDACGDGG